MTILYYFENGDSITEQYRNEASNLPDDVSTLFFEDFSLFIGYLELPKHEQHIAVVSIADDVSLMELISRYQVFWNVQFIVLIPVEREELIRKVHLLRPRFIGYAEMSCHEITSVLYRMLKLKVDTTKHCCLGERAGRKGKNQSSVSQAVR